MAGFDNDIMFANNVDFRGVEPVVGQVTTNGQLLIGSTASPNIRVNVPTINANGNIQTGAGTLLFNPYNTAKWIVDPTSNIGTHTTIAGALAAASSGETIFVRPGTYTENLTLKAGVNIVSFWAEGETPNVTIIGQLTASFAGTCTVSGIRLQTNSDFFLVVSGASATIVRLEHCFLNCANDTGISFTSSSSSAAIFSNYCMGNIATTGISLFASSSAGLIDFQFCIISNTGGSTTASTISAGVLNCDFSKFFMPITTSSTAAAAFNWCDIDTNAVNATALTHGGSGAGSRAGHSIFFSGTASSVSIGAGATLTMALCEIDSTNTNAITGAGTINYGLMDFDNSDVINTTTQNGINSGTWTPTITGGTAAGTTTYTTQFGQYTRVGNMVFVEATIIITAATGTGNAVIGGLPFTVRNIANYFPVGTMALASGTWTWTGGGTQLNFRPQINTTTALIDSLVSTVASNLEMTNGAATFVFSGWYRV
jgi:hypothetical protein